MKVLGKKNISLEVSYRPEGHVEITDLVTEETVFVSFEVLLRIAGKVGMILSHMHDFRMQSVLTQPQETIELIVDEFTRAERLKDAEDNT